jgi:preprotein translocase subunit SecF
MKLNIIKQRVLWWSISGIVILIGIGAMALSWQQFGAPLRPGLDFAGGTRLQLTRTCALNNTCESSLDVADIRQVLADQG